MSIKENREEYERAYTRRSNRSLYFEAREFESICDWSENVLIVACSTEHGNNIAGYLDEVIYHASFLPAEEGGDPNECLAGFYRGEKVSVVHTGITAGAYGASYMDLAMTRLSRSRARKIIIIGECSSLQEDVAMGDMVVATSAIRDDDSHHSYAASDLPAGGDIEICAALENISCKQGYSTHSGLCWSCGAGLGIYDPNLAQKALVLNRMGVLANALEAASAYLLGPIYNLRVGSVWVVADSIYMPIEWGCPCPRLEWGEGWQQLVGVGLEIIIGL